tara:strand:+ start:26192 stop:26617 length:426 start_codon:yes stop_codon:yes gene_type:complete
MKSFLLKGKSPILKWGQIPDGYFFEGTIPEGYSLAICPHYPYIIIDVDMHGDISGFENIPMEIQIELDKSFSYPTKNNGRHYWFKYTGKEHLMNKTSGLGIDLRTHNGYVRWYREGDIRDYINYVESSSEKLNEWLEKLFK